MLIKQQSDKNKFSKYKGGGFVKPFKPINNKQLFYINKNSDDGLPPTERGGFIDLSSIINAGKTIIDVVKDNKELIQTGISTVGSIANAGKAIADTIKKSKELEEIKTIQEINKKKKEKGKGKEIQRTKEQEESLNKIGQGFVKF